MAKSSKTACPKADLSELGFEWPEGVPKTYNEMFRGGSEWVKFIQGRLRHLNKVGRNFEDLYQDMALRLISADVLNKFIVKAITRPPVEMTAVELCEYVGIPLKKLEYLQWRYKQKDNPAKNIRPGQVPPWMPTPIKGGIYSHKAIYSRADVLTFNRLFEVENSNCHRNDGRRKAQKRVRVNINRVFDAEGNQILQRIPVKDADGNDVTVDVGVAISRRTVFPPSGDGFRTYLANAVHNHFANFCRTKFRREKERPLEPTSVLTRDATGGLSVSGSFEDGNSWESTLSDPKSSTPGELEARIDFVDALTEALEEVGLDPTGVGIDLGDDLPESVLTILDHMTKTGQDLPDAIVKVTGKTVSSGLARRIRSR